MVREENDAGVQGGRGLRTGERLWLAWHGAVRQVEVEPDGEFPEACFVPELGRLLTFRAQLFATEAEAQDRARWDLRRQRAQIDSKLAVLGEDVGTWATTCGAVRQRHPEEAPAFCGMVAGHTGGHSWTDDPGPACPTERFDYAVSTAEA